MLARLRSFARLFGGESLRALGRHKLRSALAMLGITVGMAAVVLVVAIGRTGAERTEAQLAALGDALVWVEAGSRNVNGVRTGTRGTTSLTVDDARAILREVPLVKAVAPNIDGPVQVAAGNRNWGTRYRGVGPDYLTIRRWTVAAGAMFTDDDVARAASVCVLGRTVKERLFDAEDAVGRTVRFGGQLCLVVGVLAPKGPTAFGHDQDDTIWFPYTTAMVKIRGRGADWLDDILCSATSQREVPAAIERIVPLLRERHHIRPGDDDDFNIRRPDELIATRIAQARTLAVLLACVAAIALLVGGIGVMNVMLAAVTQRTREIGLRLAVGARASDIRAQFLGEAVLLCLGGGMLGTLASLAGAGLVEDTLGWPLAVPPDAAVVALAFSVGVGLVFGYWPAHRASRLDPIAALRHE